ncbi:MAG: response regulator transcription factor [Candidatus Krumholzibacteriia bacterium]
MSDPIRVMVVDDEPDIVETLEYSLELRGYQVTTAFDGLDALERAKQAPPDVLLLDVMLPGCNGYEVSRLLKEWMEAAPGGERFPILLLTARRVNSPDREKFIATWSRADACIYKPFELDTVLAKIEELAAQGAVAV